MLQGLQILRKVLQGTQHSTLMQAVITEAIFEKTAGKTITIDPEATVLMDNTTTQKRNTNSQCLQIKTIIFP